MATGGNRRPVRYRNTQQVLAEILALPSDPEDSDDDEEMLTNDEDDDSTDIHVPVDLSTDDDDDDDEDILYRLATSCDETDSNNSDADSDTTVSDESDVDENDWKKNILTPPSTTAFDAVRVTPKKPFLLSEGPIDFFYRFFNDSIFDLMVEQTNLYAKQHKLRHWKDTSPDEMKAFIAILIGMGLHMVPNVDLYWSTDPLFRVQNIANIMAIKRFKKLLQGFHLNDNAKAPKRGEDDYDKLYKVRPLIVKLNEQFDEQAVTSTSQSIDEGMILFKGRSSLKQYMPLKPIKRGYKVWVRADSTTGYVFQVDVYTGKSDDQVVQTGLGNRVVKKLCEPLDGMHCHVTFDNFFASYNLMEELYSRQILATATVRPHRTDLPLLAKSKDRMQKGEYRWRSKQNTYYVKWMDSKPVHVMSTAFSPTDTVEVNRRQADGSVTKVTCPHPVAQYTMRMGGVDRFDERRSRYSVSRRSRRWWLRIFYFLLDASVVDALILHNSVHPSEPMNMLNFRSSLFRSLLQNFSTRSRRSNLEGSCYRRSRHRRSSLEPRKKGVPDDIRTRLVGVHMPVKMDKFRRCRLCSSKTNNKRSRIQCGVCGVALCIAPCFASFHK